MVGRTALLAIGSTGFDQADGDKTTAAFHGCFNFLIQIFRELINPRNPRYTRHFSEANRLGVEK